MMYPDPNLGLMTNGTPVGAILLLRECFRGICNFLAKLLIFGVYSAIILTKVRLLLTSVPKRRIMYAMTGKSCGVGENGQMDSRIVWGIV